MIYPRSTEQQLSQELFENPPAEYRGAPFWAWNGNLELDELVRQLEVFKEMGLGGAHLHVRVGLSIPYLGDEFMELIRGCVEEADRLGLRAWLYDEDRWPSGAAGGLVTQNPEFGARHLLITRTPYGESSLNSVDPNSAGARSGRSEDGRLLRVFVVRLVGGALDSYRCLETAEDSAADGAAGDADEFTIYVYSERNRPIPWFNNQTYLDTMNPAAAREFVKVTHERYLEVVGERFGTVIPAIFTDEPQYNQPTLLSTPDSTQDLLFPYTDDFEVSYCTAYGESFLDRVPELIWDGAHAGTQRYRYFEHASERFASGFADVVGGWCAEHGIALTGHLMEEPTLQSQTHATGESMRSYRSFQLPGIDLLCDRVELTTAKQAQSAARQFGREGVLSELYGVTGWHFDFRGHKLQGDWQAALGITVRVHHLAWVTMEGEAKRDYPASIGYQSPWWKRYRIIEDHFARVNTVLTRGRPICRVGVIHPVESFWMDWGPESTTGARRREQDRRFSDITDWLIRNQVDFDYLSESHLPGIGKAGSVDDGAAGGGSALHVGQMEYEVVVVPSLRTIRSTTLDLLDAFVNAGGTVVVAGELPAFVDGIPSDRAESVFSSSARGVQTIPFTETAILSALRSFRDVEILSDSGGAASNVIYQLRQDGETSWLFLTHVDSPSEPSVPVVEHYTLRLRGRYSATIYDTADGSTRPASAYVAAGPDGANSISAGGKKPDSKGREEWTELEIALCAHDSLLLRLDSDDPPAMPVGKLEQRTVVEATSAVATLRRSERSLLLDEPASYSLSEPNVFLLDQARWKLDNGQWHEEEEVLRLDQLARAELGWPPRGGRMAQPWVEPDSDAHSLTLEFTFETEVELSGCSLAVERIAETEVRVDGVPLEGEASGFWTDRSINTVPLPNLSAGNHTIEVSTSISRRTGAEWCYLLGEFGVRVRGRHATIEALPERIYWGDLTIQGFPFYAGNVTYAVSLPKTGGVATGVQVNHFAAAFVDVTARQSTGSRLVGPIAISPYVASLDGLDSIEGLELTAYGTRQNAFGPVHWAVQNEAWYGPGAWRSTGTAWSYQYQLEAIGVLSAPTLLY